MATLWSSGSSLIFFTNSSPRRVKMRTMAAINVEHKMRVPYELKKGQSRIFHRLPSGLNMEVIFQEGLKHEGKDDDSDNPPLVFIHGSYHAAWCWAEHWLPYFSQNGYDCYALSLLGQGESDAPTGPFAGTLQTHASDVADFIQKEIKLPPVLVGHSFGGLIVQYYIANVREEEDQSKGNISLVVFRRRHSRIWMKNSVYRNCIRSKVKKLLKESHYCIELEAPERYKNVSGTVK